MGQIRCDIVAFHGYDSERQQTMFLQHLPGGEDLVVEEDYAAATQSLSSPPGRTTCCIWLAAGHTNAQIARRLGISEGTVRTHLENIYERLHVSSRTAAVIRALPDRDHPHQGWEHQHLHEPGAQHAMRLTCGGVFDRRRQNWPFCVRYTAHSAGLRATPDSIGSLRQDGPRRAA